MGKHQYEVKVLRKQKAMRNAKIGVHAKKWLER